MYCRVLACDFDGTGASNGYLAPEVAAALHAARGRGVATLLVTGRVLEDLRAALVDFSAFDAIVAENGALVWIPDRDRTIQLGAPPPDWFLGRLRAAGIAFEAGVVVVGTWDRHAGEALELIREAGVDLQLVFNRAAVMLLPSGVNKAVGARRALAELGRPERDLVAFGDAENDLPLFAMADVAIAARGAVPAVAAVADERLARPGGEGVASYVSRLIAADFEIPTPARQHLHLGWAGDGSDVVLPLGDRHVLLSGDPRSGKSWLAGLLAEGLVEDRYRICLFDPEGDHDALAGRPGVALLGHEIPLPKPGDIPTVMQDLGASVVLSLTGLDLARKCAYVCTAFEALATERRRTGVPHWTLVDEAHYFFREDSGCCAELLSRTGSVALVTYRPSLLPPAVHDAIGVHVLMQTEVESERYFVEGLLGSRGPSDLSPVEALAELRDGRAGLLLDTADGPRWQTFTPGPRLSSHVHHARKYAEEGLPDDKAFRFLLPGGGIVAVARNVHQFADQLLAAPIESLRHHLGAGDFTRWARDVLGDPELAAGFAKLGRTASVGAPVNRDELVGHVRARYSI